MTITKEDVERVIRGPADLEETIDQLKQQKELLQFKCRQAGAAILDLERQNKDLKNEIDRLSEENSNIKIIAKR
jgi:hypothetical protein|tara:strand:+ start:217 stop:438 length:222 start_codon:yes stop_codon:yes gene_type:complete